MENVKNGGAGSGDFDHAGNPPHVGGSEPIESRHARGFKSKSERKEKSILEAIKERNKKVKELKENKTLKDLKMPKTFEEQQKEDIEKGELVNITKDYYNRASREELKKEFNEVQKEFIKWKDKKNTSEYKNYKNKLLQIKEIYDKRFGTQEVKKEENKKEMKANNSLYKHEFIEY